MLEAKSSILNTFYLYTHLGLGDIILCNGLIREVCAKYPNVTIFCKPEYYTSVSFMFRDIKNLTIEKSNDHLIKTMLLNVPDECKYVVGHGNYDSLINKYTFDECFYRQIGLKFTKRWNSFYVKRDHELEDRLYKDIIDGKDYAFIHDDPSRGYIISEKYINPNLKKIRPKNVDNIFSYIKILENATEIHCMDSCFKHLADSFDMGNKKLFYHLYVRSIHNCHYTQSKNYWNKIVYR